MNLFFIFISDKKLKILTIAFATTLAFFFEPSKYLPNYLSRLTNEDKVKMYFWHALSENWEEMDYFDFLIDRRKRIAQVVKDAYETICK